MGFSPGPVTSPAMAFNPDFSTRCQFLSMEQALNPIKRTVGYLSKQSDRYDISGHTSNLNRSILQHAEFNTGKITAAFSSLAACTVSSSTKEACQQGNNFLASSF